MAAMHQESGVSASSPAAVGRKPNLQRVATDHGLPKYWRDDQGRKATLTGSCNGKVTFRIFRRGGGGREKITVSTFELYRTWFPDLGHPIPPNAMPSICNRAQP